MKFYFNPLQRAYWKGVILSFGVLSLYYSFIFKSLFPIYLSTLAFVTWIVFWIFTGDLK